MKSINLRWLGGVMMAAIVLGGVVHLVHAHQMQRIAEIFLQDARRSLAEDRSEDALRYLRHYMLLLPNDIEGLELYGKELAKTEAIGAAYLTLERVLRVQPDRVETRRQLITLAIQLHRYPEALSNIQELQKSSPEDGELWQLKGQCEIAQGDFDFAKETLNSAIEQVPERLECYVLLADLLQTKMKSPAEAATCINRMVANNPQNYRSYLKRGEWQLRSWHTVQGAAELGSSTEVSPLKQRNLRQEGIAADARRALELAPDDAEALLFSIRVAVLTNSFEDARKHTQRGLEKFSNEPKFYLARDDIEVATANSAAALDVLQRGVQAIPQNRELQWNLANRLIDSGNEAEASSVIQQLRTSGYPPERIGYLDARILLLRSQWLEAIQLLESIRPNLLQWSDLVKQLDVMLALAYRQTDAIDQQLACFRRAVDVDPQWAPSRIGLAESLLAANLVRQASEEYKKILLLPNAPPEATIEYAKTLQSLIVRREPAEQDWSEFDDALKQIEKQSPDSKWIPMLGAEKLAAQGKYQDASRLIVAAREKNPNEVDLWIVQVTLAQQAQNWVQVDELFRAADRQFGSNATLRVVQGRSLIQHHGIEATEHLKKIAQLDSGWTVRDKLAVAQNFAMMFLAIGEFDEAERLGLIGAALQPGDLPIRLVLFDVALRAKREDLMGRILQEVRAITGEGPVWHYGQAINLILQGNLGSDDKAVTRARLHVSKAKTMRPTWARIPLLSAEIDLQRGDANAATEHFQEAISLGERNPVVLNRAVSLLFTQKRFIEADQVVRLLQERQNLMTGDLIRSASEISMRLNDPARALEFAEKLVSSSNRSQDKVWLSQVLGVMGKSQEAEEQLRKVIDADGSAPEPWVVLVQVLARSNQQKKAEQVVAEAERAIAADQAPIALAQCYELLGKLDQARTRYQTALDQAPRNMVFVRRTVEFQLRTGRYGEAESVLRNALKNSSDIVEADRHWIVRNLALTLTIGGSPKQLKEASSLIDQNLSNAMTTAADERVKALVLARQSSATPRRQSIAILERLLLRESDTAIEDRFLLAKLYIATGDRSKGRAELRTILATRNKEARFIAPYLQLVLQAGEIREAELWLTRLQAIAPNDLMTAEFQSQILFAKERYSEVVALVADIASRASRDQDNPESSLVRQLWAARRLEEFARKLLNSRKEDVAAPFIAKSESLFQKYVQQRPREILALAEFHARMNRVDQSIELLKKNWTNSSPERIASVCGAVMKNSLSTSQHLAQIQELLQSINKSLGWNSMLSLGTADLMSWRGDFDGALRLYSDVLKRDRGDVAALNNKAVLLAMSGGDCAEAQRLVQQALELGGPEDVLIDSRGLVYLFGGDPMRALADFEASLKESEDAERHFHLALAYAQLKQSESARRSIRRAQELGLSGGTLHPLERQMLEKLHASLDR